MLLLVPGVLVMLLVVKMMDGNKMTPCEKLMMSEVKLGLVVVGKSK